MKTWISHSKFVMENTSYLCDCTQKRVFKTADGSEPQSLSNFLHSWQNYQEKQGNVSMKENNFLGDGIIVLEHPHLCSFRDPIYTALFFFLVFQIPNTQVLTATLGIFTTSSWDLFHMVQELLSYLMWAQQLWVWAQLL